MHAPASRARPAPLPAQPFLDLGRVPLNPAIDRRVVNRDAALTHHLLEIAIAYPISAVPPDSPEHDLSLEVAPLELRHGPIPFLAHAPSRQTMTGFATEPCATSEHNRHITSSMAPARCTSRDPAQSESNGFIRARPRGVARSSRRDRRHQFGHGPRARPRSAVGRQRRDGWRPRATDRTGRPCPS